MLRENDITNTLAETTQAPRLNFQIEKRMLGLMNKQKKMPRSNEGEPELKRRLSEEEGGGGGDMSTHAVHGLSPACPCLPVSFLPGRSACPVFVSCQTMPVFFICFSSSSSFLSISFCLPLFLLPPFSPILLFLPSFFFQPCHAMLLLSCICICSFMSQKQHSVHGPMSTQMKRQLTKPVQP